MLVFLKVLVLIAVLSSLPMWTILRHNVFGNSDHGVMKVLGVITGVMTVLGVITGVITLITPSHSRDHGERSDHTRDHGRDL